MKKGITLKIRMLYFVLINSILLNLVCDWISLSLARMGRTGVPVCALVAVTEKLCVGCYNVNVIVMSLKGVFVNVRRRAAWLVECVCVRTGSCMRL